MCARCVEGAIPEERLESDLTRGRNVGVWKTHELVDWLCQQASVEQLLECIQLQGDG